MSLLRPWEWNKWDKFSVFVCEWERGREREGIEMEKIVKIRRRRRTIINKTAKAEFDEAMYTMKMYKITKQWQQLVIAKSYP